MHAVLYLKNIGNTFGNFSFLQNIFDTLIIQNECFLISNDNNILTWMHN